MVPRLIRVLSLAAVEVGALVGGGFASGREIHEFFGHNGTAGLAGIALFALLMAGLVGLLLDVARRAGTRSYRDLTVRIAGERMAAAADPLVAIALFLGLAVTTAGAGALLATLGLGSRVVGVTLVVLITGLVVGRGTTGVVAANVAIVPLLAVMVLVVAGWPTLPSGTPWHLGASALLGPAGWASVVYFLYNGLLAVVLIASLGQERRDAVEGWLAGGMAAAVLGVLATAVYGVLARDPALARAELPLLVAARSRGILLHWLYACALGAALLTTAIGNAFGLAARVTGVRRSPGPLAAVLAAAGALAMVGFGPLVRYGYRLVAVAGAAYLAMLGLALVGRALHVSRGAAP